MRHASATPPSPAEHPPSGARAQLPHRTATIAVAPRALGAGLTLAILVAAADVVFTLAAGAGALAAAQGVVLVAVGIAAILRLDVAARLLCPRGRVVMLSAAFAAIGLLDRGFFDHYRDVAGAIVCISALVCSARWVALCLGTCVAGHVGGLALHGHSLVWMLGDGRYAIAEQLVSFFAYAAVGLLLIALLRRLFGGAPQRLADARAGAPVLTPQRALAAPGRRLALPAADPRTLIARLTRAERELVALLADGRVPKQAAADLSIALATARSRIASAKRKTGARTLDHLVALYAEGRRGA